MSAMPTESFERACRYLGWGDPSGNGLWFIGLEEGGEPFTGANQVNAWFTQDDGRGYYWDGEFLLAAPVEDAVPFPHGSFGNSKIPHWEAKIACRASASELVWPQYKDSMLWRAGRKVFHANLFPLPKKAADDWPSHFEKTFGFAKNDFAQYRAAVKSPRQRWFLDFWKARKPTATICFGTTAWQDFRELLELDERVADLSINSKLQIFEPQRVILTRSSGTVPYLMGQSSILQIPWLLAGGFPFRNKALHRRPHLSSPIDWLLHREAMSGDFGLGFGVVRRTRA